MENWINFLSVFAIFGLCIGFLMARKSYLNLFFLAGIYLVGFLELVQFLELGFASSKLIIGLAAVLILYISVREKDDPILTQTRAEMVFKTASFVLIVIILVVASNIIQVSFGIPLEISLSGLMIGCCGILQLGISRHPQKVVIGILALFWGFEMIYGVLENSLLVNGLLGGLNLLIGFTGAFFIIRDIKANIE
jgi:hypothetical protein